MARRKKRQEKRRPKKKSKAKLTSDYKRTEQEVQLMLEEVTNSVTPRENESDTQSIEFFCKTITTKSLLKILRDEDGTVEEIEDEAHSKTPTDAASLQSENRTAGSTYIQIEAMEELIIHPIVKQQHVTNMDILLYQPSNQLCSYITLPIDMNFIPKGMVRMLNRYYEEKREVPKELMISLKNEQILMKDTLLYRTFCAKQFTPIFCRAQTKLIQIPVRRLFKLHLNKLHFTEHPELLQEHRYAIACERVYDKYVEHKQQQKCETLNLKLRQERAAMQQMLNQASADNEQGNKVAAQMFLVRNLREEQLTAELERKRLMHQVIENWLMLKKIRQSQTQQFTCFKLRINIKQVENENWKERYKNDLQEVYGEQLEQFYREQREWKRGKHKTKSDNRPQKPKLKYIARELREQYKTIFEGPIIEMQRCDVGYQNLGTSSHKIRSFFMRIYLDDQFVCSSRNYRLEPDFSCHMNETFGVLLERHIPHQILITLHEKLKLPVQAKKLAKLFIVLPCPSSTEKPANKYEQYEFTAKHQPISGYLCASLFFEPQKETLPGVNPEQPLISTGTTIKTLNLDMLEKQKDNEKEEEGSMESLETNTCSFEEERLLFCSLDEVKANRRFQLLNSRQLQNDVHTKDLRFIPALEQEIVHEKLTSNDDMEHFVDMGNWMEPIDLQLHEGKKYIKSLYDAIGDQCTRLSQISKNDNNLLEGDEPENWRLV